MKRWQEVGRGGGRGSRGRALGEGARGAGQAPRGCCLPRCGRPAPTPPAGRCLPPPPPPPRGGTGSQWEKRAPRLLHTPHGRRAAGASATLVPAVAAAVVAYGQRVPGAAAMAPAGWKKCRKHTHTPSHMASTIAVGSDCADRPPPRRRRPNAAKEGGTAATGTIRFAPLSPPKSDRGRGGGKGEAAPAAVRPAATYSLPRRRRRRPPLTPKVLAKTPRSAVCWVGEFQRSTHLIG